MQEAAPPMLEWSPYARLYHKHTYTMWPRTESVAAAIVMSIAMGLVYAALMRLTDLGPDPSWAVFTFLFPLIYHLSDAAFSCTYLADEMLYLLLRKHDVKYKFLHRAGRLQFFTRVLISTLVAFTPAVALAYAVNYALDTKYPAPYYRQVPYSGGG